MSRNELKSNRRVINREFRFGVHLPEDKDEHTGKVYRPDTIVVKEKVHYSDGTSEPKLRLYKNYQRPYYITKKIYRNHKQNKQTEKLERVQKFMTTQSNMTKDIMTRLGRRKFGNVSMRDVRFSPYVYGAEIHAVNLLRAEYQEKQTEITPYTVMFYDIENDVNTKEISVVTEVHEKDGIVYIHTFINYNVIPAVVNIKKIIEDLFWKHIPDGYFKKEDVEFHITGYKDDGEVIKAFFEHVHRTEYDFLTAWNHTHDMGTMVERMHHHGLNPAEILSDPRLPKEYRYYHFKEGRTVKVKENGDKQSLDFEKQWHSYIIPASWYAIDAMSTYYFTRMGAPEVVGGYGLNNILYNVLGLGKLKFDELTDLTQAEWHIYMLEKHPYEYIVYNIWDVLGMYLLEKKNKDLSLTLPLLADKTNFYDFSSSSMRIMDDFHFLALKHGKVLGTQVIGEEFYGSLTRNNWTVTLEPWRSAFHTYRLFTDAELINNFTFYVYDADAVSAYPSATIVANLSKETTMREIISIGDIDREEFKRNNINLMTGSIAHIDYCVSMFNFPTFRELDEIAKEELGI